MKEQRIVGNNIQVLLKDKGFDLSTVASGLGYSKEDFVKIQEGRVYLPLKEIGHIASYFDISVDDLLKPKSIEDYERVGCVHFNHHFLDQTNQEEIMDLFDLMCDIEEVL